MKKQHRVSDVLTLDRLKKRFPGKLIERVDASDKAYYISFVQGDTIAVMRRDIDNDNAPRVS